MRRSLSGFVFTTTLALALSAMAQTNNTAPTYGTPVQATPYPTDLLPGAPADTAPAQAQPDSPPIAAAPVQAAPAAPQSANVAAPVQVLYAMRDANIRNGAGTTYAVIGKIPAGNAVQTTGGVAGNPQWVQLATGGFVFAGILSPTPVVIPHPNHAVYTPPPPINYPVGSCQPYTNAINIAGHPPQQVNGMACKQPDGTWKIVPNQAPVVVPGPNPYYR